MKIRISLATLSVLLLVVGCKKSTTTSSTDQTNNTSWVSERAFTNSLTPTSRDTNGTNRIYPGDSLRGATGDTLRGTAHDADNTAKNVVDRSGDSLTPGDQGRTKADVEITRAIRKSIMDKDQLSVSAKNVKIITTDGKVTLRGPVNSDDEQRTIATLAQGVPGVTSVDNQLEVKTK